MSKTSLSCAISCVFAVLVSMSQIVQVVSILDVPMMVGSSSFQSKEVSGAQYSLFLLLFSSDTIFGSAPLSPPTSHRRK